MQIPDLVGALESGLRGEEEQDTWGPDSFHMSDLAVVLNGGDQKCARSVVKRVRGEDRKESTIGKMFMFDHGHRIHERVTDLIREPLLKQGWEIIGVETPVNEFLPEWMRGTLDLELRGPNGEKVIVDYKTSRGRNFDYLNKPKAGNVIQLRGYMMVTDADYGMLLYLDREGQSTPVPFVVERDDAQVLAGMEYLKQLNELPADKEPARMRPKVKLSKNKGPDGVKLTLPWQCSYCDFLDVSCGGALKPELRDVIVGYLDKDGQLAMKDNYVDLHDAVRDLIDGE